MIEAKGIVVRSEDGLAWIRVADRQDGCGRCDEPGGCRSVRIAYAIRRPNEVFSLPDPLGLRPGDRVRLRIPDAAPLIGALASYGLGALLLVLGALAGHLVADTRHDLSALLGAALGLGLAWLFNRLLHRSRRWRGALKMEMIRDESTCTLQ